jgi:hypothetical protein
MLVEWAAVCDTAENLKIIHEKCKDLKELETEKKYSPPALLQAIAADKVECVKYIVNLDPTYFANRKYKA